MEAIPGLHQLDAYYLAPAVLGELEAQRRHFSAAAAHFRKALQLAGMKSERTFLSKKLEECEASARGN